MWEMVTRLRSDPELAALVARARGQAEAACELRQPLAEPVTCRLDPGAREIVVSWIRDGGYDRAVAEVVAADPDLADQ
jgi:hypothetical protein